MLAHRQPITQAWLVVTRSIKPVPYAIVRELHGSCVVYWLLPSDRAAASRESRDLDLRPEAPGVSEEWDGYYCGRRSPGPSSSSHREHSRIGNQLVAELYTGKITYAGHANADSEASVAVYKSLAEVEAALASQQEAERERAAMFATQAIADLKRATCKANAALLAYQAIR